ncbi:MAG TPA: baseplate J/gp47 family protein [Anaerolineae bacterium]
MEQILELHEHEDFHSIRDRLEFAESQRVLLVVPPFGDVLKRRVDLQRIQRFAQEKGLEIALVTRDLDLRALAAELHVPTFFSVEAGQRRQRWHKLDDDGYGPYRPPDRSEAYHAAQERDARIALSGDETRRQIWIGVKFGLIGIVVVAILFSAIAIVPSAEVYLVPQSERVVANVTIVADPDLQLADLEAARVPARYVLAEVKGTVTVPTTGKRAIPTTRASGVVFFVNQLNIPFRVPKGTVARTSAGAQAIRFVVTSDVDVPAGIGAQAQAPIEAVEVGVTGNVPANFINELEGVAALSLRVSNPDSTKGGGDNEVTAVDPADLDTARNLLLDQLGRQAIETLTQTTLEPSEFLLASSVSADAILDATFDKEVTEQATELTLQMRVRFSALAVDSENANAILFAAMQARSPAGYALLPEGLTFQRGTEQFLSEAGQYQFEMQGIGYAAANLDVGRALKSIAGKPRDAALSILQESLSLRQPPRITVSPNWFPLMPLLPVRIRAVVDASG